MKFVKVLLVSLLFPVSSFAGNACWSWNTNMYYTHFWKNDVYPGWGATIYPYYDDLPKVFDGAYKTSLDCGEINVNEPGMWTQDGTTCFIKINGTIYQGNSGTINYSNFRECPIDDYVPFLMLGFCVWGFLNKDRLAAAWKS